ncbi:MAG: hypothetical protein KJ915_11535 [Candidatus Omnitrophica bacterium]|nr:hypothetical protein [Candidatus Omnitrophota bacterium]
MKFSGYNFVLISVVFSILISNKVMAQNVKKADQGRVIYEQQMSYDDARKMQEIVAQLEKEKNNNDGSAVSSNPLIDAMSDGSADNSKMLDMLKILINTMGIDVLPEDLVAQKTGIETDNSEKSGVNNFKKWDDTHNWKKLRIE